MEIENFFPKYPNIEPRTDEALRPYGSAKFDDVIVSKKEFAQLKLKKEEAIPEGRGSIFDHQKYIARFLSANTGYSELLLFHSMGSGKTCSAIAAIETMRFEKPQIMKGALIFAKGSSLLKNFVQELLFVCTDGRYIPENYDRLSELERVHRTRKIVSQYYEFHTFETFAKEISKLSDATIRQRYDNRIIVIDEVHNMREKGPPTTDDLDVYAGFFRLCHTLENRKILLMSGTPMADGPEEFASVMNLILPANNQFETGKNFVHRYFDGDVLKPGAEEEIGTRIKGRVSYLRSATSEVVKKFMGYRIGRLKYMEVYPVRMSEFQSTAYAKAYAADSTERGIFANSRQAALFVFPDGTYGPDGFKQAKFVTKRISRYGTKTKTVWAMGPVLANAIGSVRTLGVAACLDRLRVFSAKYAATIEIMLNKPNDKSFAYCQYVNGSGAIVFAGLLEAFGFSLATGDERTKARRYALITNQTATAKALHRMINRFNAPDNVDGEYISIIIGSKVIVEGFTLKDVKNCFVLTQHWNLSLPSQAIARGLRVGSHQRLIDRGDSALTYDVYQMVAMPTADVATPSVDLEMCEIAESKDVAMKRIERAVKKYAFDCPLAFDRNKTVGYDGQRECEYDSCDYVCSGKISEPLDTITYDLYYSKPDEVDEFLRDRFRLTFEVSYSELKKKFDKMNEFELTKIITDSIEKNVNFVNKFGFPSFLRIRGDTLYITSDAKIPIKTKLDDFYAKNVVIENGDKFSTVVEELVESALARKIQTAFDDPKQTRSLLTTMAPIVQRELLKGCVVAKSMGTVKNSIARDDILDFFRGFFDEINGKWTVWLYADTLGSVCYDGTEWNACEPPPRSKQTITQSRIGYYGLYNPVLKDFCIRDLHDVVAKPSDRRKITVGRRCVDWEHFKLVDIIARSMMVPPRNLDFLKSDSIDDLKLKLTELASTPKGAMMTKPGDFEDADLARRVLYWSKQPRHNLCEIMKIWFEKEHLIEDNFECGSQKKHRNAP